MTDSGISEPDLNEKNEINMINKINSEKIVLMKINIIKRSNHFVSEVWIPKLDILVFPTIVGNFQKVGNFPIIRILFNFLIEKKLFIFLEIEKYFPNL